jgi:hypothetical protein
MAARQEFLRQSQSLEAAIEEVGRTYGSGYKVEAYPPEGVFVGADYISRSIPGQPLVASGLWASINAVRSLGLEGHGQVEEIFMRFNAACRQSRVPLLTTLVGGDGNQQLTPEGMEKLLIYIINPLRTERPLDISCKQVGDVGSVHKALAGGAKAIFTDRVTGMHCPVIGFRHTGDSAQWQLLDPEPRRTVTVVVYPGVVAGRVDEKLYGEWINPHDLLNDISLPVWVIDHNIRLVIDPQAVAVAR